MAVERTGLTVLYTPESKSIVVDVIFVHGLQGHPERTWRHDGGGSHKNHDATSPKLRGASVTALLKKKWRKPVETSPTSPRPPASVYWPKDLLPKLCPDARIMTFGYDTVITRGYGSIDQGNIFSHAKDLLYELSRSREKGRNIVWVAHSLGGIIVKDVLRRSNMARIAEIQDILNSTTGVVFMGTPHRGSPEIASVGDTIRRVAQSVLRMNTNEQVIRALGLDSPELELCRESFIYQWQNLGFQVKTFQEAKALTGLKLGFLGGKVVSDTSSSLDDPQERAESIAANHMDMCRFSGPEDPGFKKVGSVIQEFCKFRPIEAQCSKTLAFPQMSFRELAIKEPISDTCNWFFDLDVHQRWESRSDPELLGRFLWLKGKPGTGKSTLMKEAVKRARARRELGLVIGTFFFNARGTTLESSPLGMLRCLCWHLFDQDDHFRTHVMNHYRMLSESDKYRETAKTRREWWSPEEEELRDLISAGLLGRPPSAPPVVLFIDALDECEESGARETVRYIATLLEAAETAGQQLDVCVSSRHYPTITASRSFEVFVERGNRYDILCYIKRKIPYGIMPDRRSVDILCDLILEKSSGIFLWVVLVIDIVLRDVDEGKTASEIERSLREVPEDLLALFSRLISSIRTKERTAAVRLIQWVLLSNSSLPLNSIRTIQICSDETVQSFTAGYEEQPQNSHELSLAWDGDTERLKREICSISRGLIEVKPGTLEQQFVQFIHESVREFFITEGPRLFQSPRFLETGHVMIIRSCAHVLCIPRLVRLRFSERELSAFGAHLNLLFLQEYAANSLQRHAIEARRETVLPNAIIHLAGRVVSLLSRRNFRADRRATWPAILEEAKAITEGKASALAPHIVCDHQLISSATTLALICNNVLRSLEQNQSIGDPPFPGSPLSLLEPTRDNWKVPPCSFRAEFGALGNLRHPASDTPFALQLRQRQEQDVVSKLRILASSGANLDIQDHEGNSLLHIASWLGMTTVVKTLLEHGVNLNALNYCGMSPLFLACEYGQTGVVALLLMAGSSPGITGPEGYTPLHLAVESSNFDLVTLLLQNKADVSAADIHGSSPLHVGAKFNTSIQIIKALLRVGADEDAMDTDFFTPTQIAIYHQNYWGNPRSLWEGHRTNAEKMLASRMGHRPVAPLNISPRLNTPEGELGSEKELEYPVGGITVSASRGLEPGSPGLNHPQAVSVYNTGSVLFLEK